MITYLYWTAVILLVFAALYFVGKHSTCAVQLEHPSVSRRHAVLLRDKVRGLLVVDLASKARAACACRPSWDGHVHGALVGRACAWRPLRMAPS